MLNYQIYNENKSKWVVFIHGFSGNIVTWKNQIDDFKEHYNLLLIDLPWHGKSKINEKISKDVINKEIKSILDKENITNANFIGISLGSLVVSQFAIKHTEYIDKLIFVSSAIQTSLFCKALVVIAQPVKLLLPYKLIYHLAVAIIAPSRVASVEGEFFIKGFKNMGRKKIIEWIKYLTVILDGNNVINKLKESNKKIMFISGEYDKLFINGAKKSAKILNTKIEILEKCTHICNNDNSKHFNKKAIEFFLNA